MKNFLLVSNDHEKIILQKYIDRYAVFSIFVIICYFLTIITFCCIPVFASKIFPSEGLYPFPIESPLMMFIIYATQVHTVVQCGLCVGIDFTFAVFFLYAAARLEMLCFEIQAAKNERHLNSCIKKHQEIIKFVDETKNIVQCCLFITNIVMAVAAVCGTFPIIYRQSLGTSQFIFVVMSGCLRIYITAWPADDLMENSERVSMTVYDMTWVGRSQCIIKNICFIMQRSQKPLVINIGHLLGILSLKYYAKYLVTLLSYFTTMRAIIGDLNH
ncbi:odorant receptor 67a-like [Temnothorax curvispinosus]|uniref:Odorant receptor 67a-like n=1 Tax=Temnothorax curvispinosus TaxID=300111 RepID=A0A6J1PV68_9HYME|nr:odorant receptor 67a-like [Temnothorax curvispinosus]